MRRYLDENRRIKRSFISCSPMDVYCIVSGLGIAALLFCFIYSRGELISHYFFHDQRDTGMDFFHSIEYTRGRRPYEVFGTLYPPLANLFFYAIYLLIPGYREEWTYDFYESIRMRGTDLDLRTYQAPMLAYIAFVLVGALLLFALMDYALRERGQIRSKWTAAFLSFSYGCMTAYERGNIVILCAGLSMIFVLFYQSKNKLVKEIALLSLAAAAGLKLYPAFLGLLLIREKDWKAAVRTVLYGIAALILPFFAFEGLSAFSTLIGKVLSFSQLSTVNWRWTGLTSILTHFFRLIGCESAAQSLTGVFNLIACGVTLVLLAASLTMRTQWQSSLTIILSMLIFSSQEDYSLSMLLIPLTLFFRDTDKCGRGNIVPFICMMLLSVHIPLFYIRDEYYPRNMLIQIALVALIVWSVCLAGAQLCSYVRARRPDACCLRDQ